MESIKFEEHKEKIIEALRARGNLGISEPVTLVEGFVNQPIQNEISNSISIGGPSIPMVMLLGSNSGRIYYFALKVIMPSLKL